MGTWDGGTLDWLYPSLLLFWSSLWNLPWFFSTLSRKIETFRFLESISGAWKLNVYICECIFSRFKSLSSAYTCASRMNKYGAKIGCAIIAVCQVIFLFYALSMQLHVFDSPMFGVIPPIFGLFAAIVGVSLHLHCFIRWLVRLILHQYNYLDA